MLVSLLQEENSPGFSEPTQVASQKDPAMPTEPVQGHCPVCPGGACAPSRRDWVLEKGHRETTVPRGMAPLLVINGVLFPRGPRVVMPWP